jgi:hypothetical protein
MRMLAWKKIRAVTLFEMLLVLFISSLVAVSTFQYQQQQNQNAVADPLAQRMYLYAQTVRQFVVDNQAAIAAGTLKPFGTAGVPEGSTFTASGSGANTVYTITGITWLQALNPPGSQTPYLPKSFTFGGLNPLQLQRESLIGNDAIQVQISTTKVYILFGALYDLKANGKLEGSVTAMAATKANKLYDPLLGVSSFHYVGGIDTSGHVIPISATWDKTQTQQTYINSPEVTGNLNVAGGINLSAGLATGGAPAAEPDITGVGKLAFEKNGSITGLNTVTFSAPNGNNPGAGTGSTGGTTETPYYGGEITNLYIIQMAPQGAIDGLSAVNFASVPDSGSQSTITGIHTITFDAQNGAGINFSGPNAQINGLTTLNFGTGGTITGLQTLTGMQSITFNSGSSITGIDSITFSSGGNFIGVRNISTFVDNNTGAGAGNVTVNLNGSNLPVSKWFCALTRVDDQGGKASKRDCNMYIQNDYYIMNTQPNMTCSANCFQYSN